MGVAGRWRPGSAPEWQGDCHRHAARPRPRLALAGSPESAQGGLMLQLEGSFERGPIWDKPLQAEGLDDIGFFFAAYDRWGVDAFARVRGSFCAALFDEARGSLHLVRSESGGVIFVESSQDGFRFSNEERSATADYSAWLQTGVHGAALTRGTRREIRADATIATERLWGFVPPRDAPWCDDYGRWLKSSFNLDRSLAWAGTPEAADYFGHEALEPETLELSLIYDVARAAPAPLAWSSLLGVAGLGSPSFCGVWPLGMDAALGRNQRGRRAYLRRLARAVEAQPDRQTLQEAWRLARPVMQHGLQSVARSELSRSVHAVAARWSRHFPRQMTPPDEPELIADPVSADAFVDARFADANALELDLTAQTALALGHTPTLPFHAPSSLELVFSRRLDGVLFDRFGPARADSPEPVLSASIRREVVGWRSQVDGLRTPDVSEDRLLGLSVYRAARL